jgi:IucA / IucC family
MSSVPTFCLPVLTNVHKRFNLKMLLHDILTDPITTRPYVERYLNDGSPSGFSTEYTTSPETSPFGLTPWFHPYICIAPIDFCRTFGEIPSWAGAPFSQLNNWVIVHPDMSTNKVFRNKYLKIYKDEDLRVVPTASGRTVQIINKEDRDYIKLHYAGILGRVRRDLPYKKSIAGPELSKIIVQAIDKKLIDSRISLLRESGARVLEIVLRGKRVEWGMVWRENSHYCNELDATKYVFPAFSLFSLDRLAIADHPILKQIVDYRSANPEEFVIDTLISPMIKCYFDLVLRLGLQPEWNAQNLLIGFDKNLSPSKFILRDIESIDKDLTMMDSLKIEHDFESYPFKCIYRSQYNYTIKHSFMYDYKFGEYILDPLLLFLNKYFGSDLDKSRHKVKEIAKEYIDELPADFFPKGKWFVFDRVLVDQSISKRPYLELLNPKFRF